MGAGCSAASTVSLTSSDVFIGSCKESTTSSKGVHGMRANAKERPTVFIQEAPQQVRLPLSCDGSNYKSSNPQTPDVE
eukprot:6321690-Amphidinium_carterae.1